MNNGVDELATMLGQKIYQAYYDYAQLKGLYLLVNPSTNAFLMQKEYPLQMENMVEISSLDMWMKKMPEDLNGFYLYMAYEFKEDFQLYFVCNHPQHCKALCSKHYWRINVGKNHARYLPAWKDKVAQPLKFINQLPTSVFRIEIEDLRNFNHVIAHEGFSQKEREQFWLQYFKRRQNQLKEVQNASIAFQFITELYGKQQEKLKPYLELFPLLGETLQKKDQAFLEDIPSLSTCFMVNYGKVSQYILNPLVSQGEYLKLMNDFALGLGAFLGVSDMQLEPLKDRKLLKVLFLHENAEITPTKIQHYLKLFVDFLEQNHHITTMESHAVKKWLAHQQLTQALEEKSPTQAKARKL